MSVLTAASFFVSALVIAVALVHCVSVIARTLSEAATRTTDAAQLVADSLDAGGKALAEAMGGFWEATNADPPAFIPLDEFISQKFLEDVQGDMASHELVLETDM